MNTFVREKVCAHKRHRNIAFFRIVCGKMPKYGAVCVHILFSHNCVYGVYITHRIEYNVSAPLRHTFMASHNQKLGIFENWGFLRVKKPQIGDFEYPL